jgi:putative membrane protein
MRWLVIFFTSTTAWAHSEHASAAWNWDPLLLSSLLILSLAYGRGLKRAKSFISHRTKLLFFLSMLVLFIALVSPLSSISEELQAWHMIQHMLIMMVAAPLFVMSAPLFVLLWSLPRKLRKGWTPFYRWLYGQNSGWYFFWQPVVLWLSYAFTLWIWHLPRFYQAALNHPRLHDLQHISFFIAACLFWRVLLDPIHRLKLTKGLGILYVFATSLHATLLGVYMALAPSIWYPYYLEKTRSWGLSPLEDQQLAGLIMWMPACSIYVLVTVYLFYQWLQVDLRSEQSTLP